MKKILAQVALHSAAPRHDMVGFGRMPAKQNAGVYGVDTHVVDWNPLGNDVRDLRAPGIRDGVFDPSRPMVWPTRSHVYAADGAPITNYNKVSLPDWVFDDSQAILDNLYNTENRTHPFQHSKYGNWSMPWQGMDLGQLVAGNGRARTAPGSRLPYTSTVQYQGQMYADV